MSVKPSLMVLPVKAGKDRVITKLIERVNIILAAMHNAANGNDTSALMAIKTDRDSESKYPAILHAYKMELLHSMGQTDANAK
jgi:hypothetical protein